LLILIAPRIGAKGGLGPPRRGIRILARLRRPGLRRLILELQGPGQVRPRPPLRSEALQVVDLQRVAGRAGGVALVVDALAVEHDVPEMRLHLMATGVPETSIREPGRLGIYGAGRIVPEWKMRSAKRSGSL